ncbi:MAG: hypothetical protein NVS2B3_13840 [Vulcanimicrobiaceae bacterium]
MIRKNRPETVPAQSAPETPRFQTMSHTMPLELAERLRRLAFDARLSESAVLEYALATLLANDDPAAIVARMRDAGYGLRRRTR